MASVSFIPLSHSLPIKFYFLTTNNFQIICFLCFSIVCLSVSSYYCRYHSLSHSPPKCGVTPRRLYRGSFTLSVKWQYIAFQRQFEQVKSTRYVQFYIILRVQCGTLLTILSDISFFFSRLRSRSRERVGPMFHFYTSLKRQNTSGNSDICRGV